jgi:NAD(P)-dependent dehydrogenase (short-subunit alcohol dehydrogenase family)
MSAAALAGRTVLVTGASRGIGRGLAQALAEAGADLVVTARDVGALAGVVDDVRAQGRTCLPLALELRDGPSAIEAFADRAWRETGGIDVVVNNAGLVLYRPALETTDTEWLDTLQTNLSAAFWSCRAFGRRMLERGHGKLVNVASDIGIRGEANWAAYAASKGGVVSLSKSLAWEWAPKVTVNVIAPGPFYSDANKPMFDVPEIRGMVEERVPLHRIGEPRAHLGPLAVLLAGAGSDFMTGAVFRVDGGICRS